MLAIDQAATESRRQAIQLTLDSRKSPADRNRLGQFATPYPLAVDIARYVRSIASPILYPVRFADPSFGTGSFYSAALAVFGADRIQAALGVEIDSAFCDTARKLWSASGLRVLKGDFTRIVAETNPPAPPNLVLTNPPYVRHHHLSREQKAYLQSVTFQKAGVKVSGLAGLYVYFVLLTTEWMEDGGYAAWLLPSEFMDVKYGVALKRYLANRVTLVRLHRFDPEDVQFDDALVSSVVVVLRKTAPPAGHAVEFTLGGTILKPKARDRVSLQQLVTSRKWTLYPAPVRSKGRAAANGYSPVLGDFFRVQRGIATGGNKFFIIQRSYAERRGFPRCFLRPVLPSPRYLRKTIIEADETGYPLLEPQLCVIDCDIQESDLRSRYPELWKYLQRADSLGIKQGYIVRKRHPWYRQERREPAPFLCTYMGRGSGENRPFRFIWNRSQAIATNLYLMLYPKNQLATLLVHDPDCAAEVFELLKQVTDHELRSEGRVYGGGLNKIEPRELARVSASAFVKRWPELCFKTPQQRVLFDGTLSDDST